jgi:hypothetical protein
MITLLHEDAIAETGRGERREERERGRMNLDGESSKLL